MQHTLYIYSRFHKQQAGGGEMSVSLENGREKLFLRIDKVVLSDTGISLFTWNNYDTAILNSLLDEGEVTEEEMLAKIHEHILKVGIKCFEEYKKGCTPDHTASPYAFAYALRHGVFTVSECESIEFDFTETLETFIERYYKKDLPERMLKNLRTKREPFRLSNDSGHCCC